MLASPSDNRRVRLLHVVVLRLLPAPRIEDSPAASVAREPLPRLLLCVHAVPDGSAQRAFRPVYLVPVRLHLHAEVVPHARIESHLLGVVSLAVQQMAILVVDRRLIAPTHLLMKGRIMDAVQVHGIGPPTHLDRPGGVRLLHMIVHELEVFVPLALVSDGPEHDRGVALVALDHLPKRRDKSLPAARVLPAGTHAPYRRVLGLDVEPQPVTEVVEVRGPREVRGAQVVHVPGLQRPQIPFFDFRRNIQTAQRVVGQEVDAPQLDPLPVDVHLVALDLHLPEPDPSLDRLHLNPVDDQRCAEDIEMRRLGGPMSRVVHPHGRRVRPAATRELEPMVLRYPGAVDLAHRDRNGSFLPREHAGYADPQPRVPIVRIELRHVMKGRDVVIGKRQ